MQNDYSVAAHWNGPFDEDTLRAWAEQLRARLKAPNVSIGLVFMAPRFFSDAPQILELLRVHAQIPLLVGCSSGSLICGDEEWEEDAGIVLGLYALPGATLQPFRFTQEQVDEASSPAYWHMETGLEAEQVNGWLAFADRPRPRSSATPEAAWRRHPRSKNGRDRKWRTGSSDREAGL